MSYQGGHVHLRSERPYLRNLDPAQYMCHDPERGVHVIRLFDDCTHMHTRCEVVCERLRATILACTCIICCSIAAPLPESSGPRIEHCCFQESPYYNVLALYMSNSECACVSCVSQCTYVCSFDPTRPSAISPLVHGCCTG